MPAGQGVLAIRDTDEDRPLGSPTRITGTVDDETGVISGATLSTPPLNFDTVALGLPVDVTATFSQVTPGGGTGLVAATPPAAAEGEDQAGQVTLRDSVRVTLDLIIGPIQDPILVAHCVTPPVSLELISTTPYTASAGGTIVDPDFRVPAVEANNSDCISQVASGVNDLLAGSGHSLSMFIQGDLPVPELKPETTTTLTVDPSEGSVRGAPVTLTAAVAEVEPNDLDPTGTVVFREGTRIVGTADLDPDGTATLTTTALRSGDRSLTAAYQGDVEFAPSTSVPVAYSVAPAPILTSTFPEHIVAGAAPVEFDLTIDNTGSPRAIVDGRVDVAFPGVNGGNLVLERQLPDTSWVTVALPYVPSVGGVVGDLGPEDGNVVAADAVVTHRLRISALSSARLRSTSADFRLTVDPESGEDSAVVAAGSWNFDIVGAARVATQILEPLGVYDPAPRPGQVLIVEATVMTESFSSVTTGQVEFLLDGRVVPVRPIAALGPLPPKQNRLTVSDSGFVSGETESRVVVGIEA